MSSAQAIPVEALLTPSHGFNLPLNSRWTILEKTEDGWKTRCTCGSTKTHTPGSFKHVISGKSRSCGCLVGEACGDRNKTHGLSLRPEYQVWKAIWQRCTNPKHIQYCDYGARGITVCARWRGRNGFVNFYEDMGPRPDGYTIERRRTDGHYAPDNCLWASYTTQGRNRRDNLLVTYDGKTQCVSAWAEETGIAYSCLYDRIVSKWPIEKALTTPSSAKPIEPLTYRGQAKSVTDWARHVGLKPSTVHMRLKAGWSIERALALPVREERLKRLKFRGKSQTVAEWSQELGISYSTLKMRLGAGWSVRRALTTPIKTPL